MKRIKKEEDTIYQDCWIYVLLLTTLVILLESLKNYTFRIANVDLTFSLFLLPFIYLVVNYIAKKYDYKKAVAAIAISGVLFACYSAITSFALGEVLILSRITGEFCAYVVSQFINLTVYIFLLNNTKQPVYLIYLNYLLALVVYYLFYTLIYLQMITLDNYWTGYFITLAFQSVICVPIAIFDYKIKRGEEK